MDSFIDKLPMYVPMVIDGSFSVWFFDTVVANGMKFIQHNFLFLWLFTKAWHKFAKTTKTKLDDKWSAKLLGFLGRFRSDNSVPKDYPDKEYPIISSPKPGREMFTKPEK